MGYIIYVDLIWAVNLVIDYLLLKAYGVLFQKKMYPFRLWLAAVIGASLQLLPVYGIPVPVIMFSFLLIKTAYPDLKGKRWIIAGVSIAAEGALLAGMLEYLCERKILGNGTLELLLASFLCMELILFFGKRIVRTIKSGKHLYPIYIEDDAYKLEGMAFLDTGNQLYDPFFQRPVLVGNHPMLLLMYSKKKSEQVLWIPYRSLGNSAGMIPVITVDRIRIGVGENALWKEKVLIAVTEQKLSGDGRYHFLLHEGILS